MASARFVLLTRSASRLRGAEDSEVMFDYITRMIRENPGKKGWKAREKAVAAVCRSLVISPRRLADELGAIIKELERASTLPWDEPARGFRGIEVDSEMTLREHLRCILLNRLERKLDRFRRATKSLFRDAAVMCYFAGVKYDAELELLVPAIICDNDLAAQRGGKPGGRHNFLDAPAARFFPEREGLVWEVIWTNYEGIMGDKGGSGRRFLEGIISECGFDVTVDNLRQMLRNRAEKAGLL